MIFIELCNYICSKYKYKYKYMAQPIRKQIQEIHKDIIKEPPTYTLLVDGGSLLFHCMKDNGTNIEGIHYGGIFQFLLQLRIQLQKKDFDNIFVVFDNEYSGYLRWQLYNQYKANRDKHYEDYELSDYMKEVNARVKGMQQYFNKNKTKKAEHPDSNMNTISKTKLWEDFVDENFDRERDELCRIFNELYIRWEMHDIIEGDDLIAYYCKNKKKNEKIVIMSGDMDLSQLLTDDICIYNLNNKKYITTTNFKEYFGYCHENIAIRKIMCGDVSDNIGNIKGLSETGLENLIPEINNKKITLNDIKVRAQEMINERIKNKKKPLQVHENIINGISNKQYNGNFYEINEKLINLKNPILTKDEEEYIMDLMYAPQDPEGRSLVNVSKYIDELGIMDLKGDTKFATFFSPFKRYMDKEILKFKNI